MAVDAGDAVRTRSGRARLPTQGRGEALLLLGPCALYLVAFSIFPLVTSLVRSFQDYDTRADTWTWIGLRNYSQLIHSSEFWTRGREHPPPHRCGGGDPGRARDGAGALLQSAAPRLVDRARDPDPADAADADRRRPDVACAAQPRVGAAELGRRRARLRLRRLAVGPARRDLDADPRRLLAVDAVRVRDRLRPAAGTAARGLRGGIGRRRELVPADRVPDVAAAGAGDRLRSGLPRRSTPSGRSTSSTA